MAFYRLPGLAPDALPMIPSHVARPHWQETSAAAARRAHASPVQDPARTKSVYPRWKLTHSSDRNDRPALWSGPLGLPISARLEATFFAAVRIKAIDRFRAAVTSSRSPVFRAFS